MATQPGDLRMTLVEFLAWDDGTVSRYEQIDGRLAGIVTPNRPDSYLQADLAVSSRPRDQQDRDVAEPILVVDVESPGTVRHDRGVKVDRYRELASVQEILVVARSGGSSSGAARASAGASRT